MGSDLDMNNGPTIFWLFQSTLPGWGATRLADITGGVRQISIHAPRMGSDEREEFIWVVTVGISIHAPRMGSD